MSYNRQMRHILVVDNNLHVPCQRCSRLTYGFEGEEVTVVRPLKDGLPKNLSRYTHIVLSGSAGQIEEHDKLFKLLAPFIKKVADKKIPLLGICYGHQAIIGTFASANDIKFSRQPEIGWIWIRRLNRDKSRLLKALPRHFWAVASHIHEATKAPADFMITASSKRCKVEAIEHISLPIFGVQFHPESGPYRLHKILRYWHRHKANPRWYTKEVHNDRHFSPKLEHKIFQNFYNTKSQQK